MAGSGVAVGGTAVGAGVTSDGVLVGTGVDVASTGPGVGVGPVGGLVGVSVGTAVGAAIVGVAVGVSTGDTCDVKRANAPPVVIIRLVSRIATTPSGSSTPRARASRRISVSSTVSRRCM